MTDHGYELEQDQAAEVEHILQLKEKTIMDALAEDEAGVTESLLSSFSTHVADRGGCFFEAIYERDHDAIVEHVAEWWDNLIESDDWEDWV